MKTTRVGGALGIHVDGSDWAIVGEAAKEKASSDEDGSDSDSDEEDDTAELLRELEKIKRERAAEKARQEAEANEQTAAQVGLPSRVHGSHLWHSSARRRSQLRTRY